MFAIDVFYCIVDWTTTTVRAGADSNIFVKKKNGWNNNPKTVIFFHF